MIARGWAVVATAEETAAAQEAPEQPRADPHQTPGDDEEKARMAAEREALELTEQQMLDRQAAEEAAAAERAAEKERVAAERKKAAAKAQARRKATTTRRS